VLDDEYCVLITIISGNDNRDACNYSPAAAENAVTVGASTLGDERAYFSNHGSCVDVFAPGMFYRLSNHFKKI
jgi:cerevisin